MAYKHLWWLLPVAAFILIAPFTPWIDMSAARWFYAENGNKFIEDGCCGLFFDYGVLPGQIGGLAAAFLYLLSFALASLRKWRPAALAMVLTMALGAGFIVHTVLKDHWGRPRPRQVVEFGGKQEFRPFYKPNFFNQPEHSRSFPCGHCTMGFFFFSVAFALKRMGYRRWAMASMVFAVILGIALGLARMAMGGHFFSDVIASALILWLCAGLFDWLTAPRGEGIAG